MLTFASPIRKKRIAQVAKLVDALVSGASAARLAGSTPVLGTERGRVQKTLPLFFYPTPSYHPNSSHVPSPTRRRKHHRSAERSNPKLRPSLGRNIPPLSAENTKYHLRQTTPKNFGKKRVRAAAATHKTQKKVRKTHCLPNYGSSSART